MNELHIDKCQILFGDKGIASLDEYLEKNAENITKIIILGDTNSFEHALVPLVERLEHLGEYEMIEIDPGEENKNIDTCTQLWETLAEIGADRRSLLINVGGGVVCDMGGYVASCYMRGIRFINIPTTLLSQVDASVGGKTGVDLGQLKNIVGLFTLPEMVVVSSLFLSTLPQREILSGFAEMIKHGLIMSEKHWKELSSQADFSLEKIEKLVYDSVKIKYDVVLQDPHEKGIRKALNFGHTIGHAIEGHLMNTQNAISHGHAVAVGMVSEVWLSTKICGLDEHFATSFKEYIKEMYPLANITEDDLPDVMSLMAHDKKNTERGINFSLLKNIGEVSIDHYIPEETIKEAIRFYIS
ncbi:MAG: 3-dehydroquinate synthase [Flavobacteriales bacterium]|nr:3-dehydroquinate synthase [Flavobacteriales bacterium]